MDTGDASCGTLSAVLCLSAGNSACVCLAGALLSVLHQPGCHALLCQNPEPRTVPVDMRTYPESLAVKKLFRHGWVPEVCELAHILLVPQFCILLLNAWFFHRKLSFLARQNVSCVHYSL